MFGRRSAAERSRVRCRPTLTTPPWIAKGATAGMSYEPAEHAELRMFSENFAEIGPGITPTTPPDIVSLVSFPGANTANARARIEMRFGTGR